MLGREGRDKEFFLLVSVPAGSDNAKIKLTNPQTAVTTTYDATAGQVTRITLGTVASTANETSVTEAHYTVVSNSPQNRGWMVHLLLL